MKKKKSNNPQEFIKKGTSRVSRFITDFKNFITRGSVLDLAVAVIMGAAFGKIVSSLVDDIVMPMVLGIFGKNDISSLYFYINTAQVRYGVFLQTIIDFLLISLFVFLAIRLVMNIRKGYGESKKFTKRLFSGKLKPKILNKTNRVTKSSYAGKFFKSKPTPAKLSTEDLLAQILEEIKKKDTP